MPNISRFGHRLWCKRVSNNGPHIECSIRFEPNINKKHRSPTNQTESTITAVSSALRVLNQFVPPIRRFRFEFISIPFRFGSMSIFVLTFGCSDFVRSLLSAMLQRCCVNFGPCGSIWHAPCDTFQRHRTGYNPSKTTCKRRRCESRAMQQQN